MTSGSVFPALVPGDGSRTARTRRHDDVVVARAIRAGRDAVLSAAPFEILAFLILAFILQN